MPPDNAEATPPGFGDDDLRRTLNEHPGVGADEGLPDEVRFCGAVTRLIRKLLDTGNLAGDSAPAVFVMSGAAPPTVPAKSLKVAPMLDNGLTSVENHIWFVGPTATLGRGLAVGEWQDDEVFASASALSVGECPTILFETRTENPEARFYPQGLNAPEEYELLRLGGTDLSIDDVLEVVDHVYETSLVSPSAQSKTGKLWERPTKLWPSENAEDLVQMYLRTGLATAFPSCIIRAEQTQATGRLDLEVEEPDPSDRSTVTRHALLELKVLRAFGSGGSPYSATDIRTWVTGGVKQAEEYREDRGTRASALCCFDMRQTVSGEECFRHVRKLALEGNVTLRVWHLFASDKAYRDFRSAARRSKSRSN